MNPPEDQQQVEEKAPIWEIWRSIWGDFGVLEAVADALPDHPAAGTLRGYQEHGLPEILPTAEKALREAGLEPDQAVADKSYHRSYQVTTLLIREAAGEKVPREEYERDPDEFYKDAQRSRAVALHAQKTLEDNGLTPAQAKEMTDFAAARGRAIGQIETPDEEQSDPDA